MMIIFSLCFIAFSKRYRIIGHTRLQYQLELINSKFINRVCSQLYHQIHNQPLSSKIKYNAHRTASWCLQFFIIDYMLDLTYRHADQILRSPQGHSLFIGDLCAAEDPSWLHEHKIRTVITAAMGLSFQIEGGLRHIRYDLQDRKTEKISNFFESAAIEIDRELKTGSVLVHCGAGVSRSPTLVIAYLIRMKGMSFLEALRLLKSKRPQVCPNLGFQLQLKTYQRMQNATLDTFMMTFKGNKPNLPQIAKHQPLSNLARLLRTTGRKELPLSRSLKPAEKREDKEVEYLRKMAQFRFGITNISWRRDNPSLHLKNNHK